MTYFGLVAVACYFIHIFVGKAYFPHYDPKRQAVSELTARYSPSRKKAVLFADLYGLFSTLFSIFFLITVFDQSFGIALRLAAIFLIGMCFISFIGYRLFPLTKSHNRMHLVVTAFVVALTILALIFFMIGFIHIHVALFGVTLFVMLLLLIGAMLTNLLPTQYFGIAERINAYSTVLYIAILAVWSHWLFI